MDLDAFAEYFTSKLPITALVYDNRGFGASDAKEGAPRHEIIPREQQSDYSDAITYAQTLSDVDPEKIAVWGSSYSGGHVLYVGAVDRRVKAVLAQVWVLFLRCTRLITHSHDTQTTCGWLEEFRSPYSLRFRTWNGADVCRWYAQRFRVAELISLRNQLIVTDRHGRMAGKDPVRIPVVDENPMNPSALPTADSYKFFTEWEKKSDWKNDVTLRRLASDMID